MKLSTRRISSGRYDARVKSEQGYRSLGVTFATRDEALAWMEAFKDGVILPPPADFVGKGHNARPVHDRWLASVSYDASGCLVWNRSLNSAGYGVVSQQPAHLYAHRYAYERYVGPIPDGFEVDHLCRNRACSNPLHLEAVTRQVNQRRGMGPAGVNARKTHCVNGHEFTPENTYIRTDTTFPARQCRACHRLRMAARARRAT